MTDSNKTILIIEADLSLRTVLRMAMESEGHSVMEADTELAALDLIKRSETPIHCIVNRISTHSRNNGTKFGSFPVISPPDGLLNLHDLHQAISAAR